MAKPEEKTILVVDDEPDVRQYLAAILEDAGFNVLTAGDGDEALRTIRQHRPDFISLDLIMPRKSGHKLLYELRKDKELARIPVLIVTAHARDDLGKTALEDILESSTMSGPGIYLEKPIQPLNYVRSIQRVLGIEETQDTSERFGLKEELQKELQKADSDALRKALQALKASTER
jgi:two-component system alkaline phosphatase synthesis response regulator PhoP